MTSLGVGSAAIGGVSMNKVRVATTNEKNASSALTAVTDKGQAVVQFGQKFNKANDRALNRKKTQMRTIRVERATLEKSTFDAEQLIPYYINATAKIRRIFGICYYRGSLL